MCTVASFLLYAKYSLDLFRVNLPTKYIPGYKLIRTKVFLLVLYNG